jgi:hypothetical protein
MPVSNEQFDQQKIDRLKHFLETMAAKGQARPYEIFVDHLKVIPKTDDPKEFDNYDYYLHEDTEKIAILIYNTHASPRNDKYCFYLQQGVKKQGQGFNGLGEVEEIIQEKLAARDKEYAFKKLQEDLAAVEQQLSEAEEYATELEQQLQDAKSNKYKLGNINMGELASIALEGFVRRNPQLIAKLPGGEALAGVLALDSSDKVQEQAIEPATQASFQKKISTDTLTEEQKRHSSFLAQLEQVFDETQLETMMHIIQRLAEQPHQLETVKQLLNKQ